MSMGAAHKRSSMGFLMMLYPSIENMMTMVKRSAIKVMGEIHFANLL